MIGTYSNKFNNDGELVRLVSLSGDPIADFTFNDVWYPETDGNGFTLTLRNDSSVPADYSDALSWQPGSQIGGTPGRPEAVQGGDFEEWQIANFSAAELADPLVSGPLADPDHDCLSNLLEYGMGLPPQISNPDALELTLVTVDDQDFLALKFQQKQDLTDASFSIEVSSDLENWTSSNLPFGDPIDNLDGTETVILRSNVPTSDDPSRSMIRLKIKRP